MEILTIVGLLLLLGSREYLSYKERKDLYNRLMSKNVDDYKILTDKEEPIEEDEEDENMVDMALNPSETGSIPDDIKEEMQNG